MKAGEKTGVEREKPRQTVPENATYKNWVPQTQTKIQTCTPALVASIVLGKRTCKPCATRPPKADENSDILNAQNKS